MCSWNASEAHIVYASDDRFAEILGVSLVSLYENSGDMSSITVYVLDSGITQENKAKIEEVCKSYDRPTPVWIKGLDISEVLSMKVTVDRGSLSQYARLFVAGSLPRELGRVLYLDCDIIIKKSIGGLWNIDLQGKTIGAAKDAFSRSYRANIGLQPNDIMFNSGVMLIDLDRWREQNVEERLLDFISRKKGKIQQGDQGALNAVLTHDICCIDPRFNSVTIYHDFSYREMMIYRKPAEGFYSEEQVEAAANDPSIIHFTTSFLSKRPWIRGCQHRYVNEWLKYKELSPWKSTALWEDDRPRWKQKITGIYRALPNALSVRIAGIAQAYGRPFINRIKH
ncbi:MAG: glycosyltransferase family 8 protein [Oscillospiraceae bacterium]|nr:glycosyltransferase family 8 protein [Oscillospiraceae bacterium]